jgi:transposase
MFDVGCSMFNNLFLFLSAFQHFSISAFTQSLFMNTIPLEIRQRILDAYDAGKGTREEIAHRFGVSTGMVKKLLQQRCHTGDIAPQHHRSGRKPIILPSHRKRMRQLVSHKPDITLAQLRESLALQCSLSAIHQVLGDMGLTLRNRTMKISKALTRLQ